MSVWLKIDVCGREKLHPTLWKLFGFIINFYESKGKSVYITSIAEGLHANGSFHYIWRAIDFKRNGFIKKDIVIIINAFCTKYNIPARDFDLLEYSDSRNIFHIEYDPK